MTISPVSRVSAIHGSQNVQNQGSSNKKSESQDPATDTVHLSPAALAHLQGGDQDHDGDSH